MKTNFTDMFRLDWQAVDLSKSTLGVGVILIALILQSTIGPFGFTVAFGAALALLVDGGGPRRARLIELSTFSVFGTLATLLGNGVAGDVWGSLAVIFAFTLICGLMMVFGATAGKMAFMANLWMIISLSLSTVMHDPINLAFGFAVGSGSIVLLVWVLSLRSTETEKSDTYRNLKPLQTLTLHSSTLHFAVSRALMATAGMGVGVLLDLQRAYWIPLTFLIVVVPDRAQAAQTSWQRAIGTAFGVVLGAIILTLPLEPITLLLLWLLVVLIMLALQTVNYVLYVTVLTLNLILLYQLLETDVLFNGLERLVATFLGMAFALAAIALMNYLAGLPESK